MATASVPNNFTAGVASDADAVDANFQAIIDFINDNVVQTDGSNDLTAVQVGITPTLTGHVATKGYVDGVVTATELSGVIKMYGGAAAPTGYLLCNGAAVSRATYSALFTAIGTGFGAGNGSTTFNVPDLMGRNPMGAGAGTGLTARTLGTQVGAIATSATGDWGLVGTTGGSDTGMPRITHTHAFTPPSTVVTFIIKT